jgi:L,D-peptidoglycan transpeptidase YkuD (ErfK/YbiS/YcfS/YnhG family)
MKIFAALMLVLSAWAWWWGHRIWPKAYARALPAECQQVILVKALDANGPMARTWLYERRAGSESWSLVGGPWLASVGRNGLAWGISQASFPKDESLPVKQEGDGRSPAGIFPIPFAFGDQPAPAEIRLPWKQNTPSLKGVDDPKSRFYNQVVDANTITNPDWQSAEDMLRKDDFYSWGAMIGHNPHGTPYAGSCIFLHLWQGPGIGTAGCTALEEAQVREILRWLDPAKHPRLIQILE